MASLSFSNTTFDDRDTDHIKYAGGWFLTGSWNASSVGETGTLSSTNDITANFTFTFPTPARSFYYFAPKRCCGGWYLICIDCDPNNPVWEIIDAVNITDDGRNPPVALFSKTFDVAGIHEVIITNQNDTRFGKSQITIDRLVLEVPSQTDLEPLSSSSSPSASPTSAASASPTPGATNQASDKSTGAIVGGAVGGAVVLCILAFLIYFFCRRRRRTDDEEGNDVREVSHPYPLAWPTSSLHRRLQPLGLITSSSSASTSKYTSTEVHSRQPRAPRRETDAGQVPVEDDNDSASILPPEYYQVFRRPVREDGRASGSSTPQSQTATLVLSEPLPVVSKRNK